MAVGDVLKVRYMSRFPPQLGQNIRHYRISTETSGGATLLELANALFDTLGPMYAACLSFQTEFFKVAVQRVRPLPVMLEVESTRAALAGGVVGDALPSQVAGIITLTTGVAGRANRGRSYIPFPAEASSGLVGRPTAGYGITLNVLGVGLITTQVIIGAVGTTTLVPVLFRRGPGTTSDLSGQRSREIWATQRRRGDYGAPNLGDVT